MEAQTSWNSKNDACAPIAFLGESMFRYRLRRMEALIRRLSGIGRGGAAPPARRLQTAQDVIDLLQEQVEALRAETSLGSVERARAIGYLAGIARKAIEAGTITERMEILESILRQRRSK
jgi:hypothetical protein